MNDYLKEYERYIKELNRILVTFDVNLFRKFYYKQRKNPYLQIPYIYNELMNNDRWVLGFMCKMICNNPEMSQPIVSKAREILDGYGWDYEIFV